MENAEEFEKLLYALLEKAEKKLNMTDRTLAYILLREGIAYYLRTICQGDK